MPSAMSFATSSSAAATPLDAASSSSASSSSSSSSRSLATVAEAVEIIDSRLGAATTLMLTCEHASMRLPSPWQWPADDARLLGTHWSYDPFASEFTRELAARLPCVGVLSRFSRLLCDPNREKTSATMFRRHAENAPVHLNSSVNTSPGEIQLRIDTLYQPYHDALVGVHRDIRPTTVLSTHSFTDLYEGEKRVVEIGVLYNDERDLALASEFVRAFRALGVATELNLPWSAKDGFMFAADQFSSPDTAVIMLELRQDLAADVEWRRKVVAATQQVLTAKGHAI